MFLRVIIVCVALFALTVLSGQTAAHVGRHAHVVGGAVYEHSCCQSFAQALRNRPTALFMKFWKPFILKLRKLLILWLTLFRSSLVHFHYNDDIALDCALLGLNLLATEGFGHILFEDVHLGAQGVDLRCRRVDFGFQFIQKIDAVLARPLVFFEALE